LLAVGGDSVRRAISDGFEVFRGCGWGRATVADAVRGLRFENEAVEFRVFACKTTLVSFIAGDCVSCVAGSAMAEIVGAGSVLTIEVV